jgi:hypothetical protein
MSQKSLSGKVFNETFFIVKQEKKNLMSRFLSVGLLFLGFPREGKTHLKQGCQIFLDKIFPNGKKYTTLPRQYPMAK